jgi:multiple antibiotic resistance protein
VSLFIGEIILGFFGISFSSFRVAGGILILLMAIAMMHAKTSGTVRTKDETEESESKDSIAVVPLAIPLLAGPGAISTIILYAHKGSGFIHYFLVTLVIVFATAILYLSLKSTPYISKYLSKTGVNIFTRIMGLILTAIAIEFIANGLKGLFPILAKIS